jgi:hypothetical protein
MDQHKKKDRPTFTVQAIFLFFCSGFDCQLSPYCAALIFSATISFGTNPSLRHWISPSL